jgi:RNA polymerase sigma-70 factor (ECF subfamily)
MLASSAIAESLPGGSGHAAPPDGERRRAFEALIVEHQPALRARAAQLCRSHLDPEDLLQEAMMRAYRGREQLRERKAARSWLLTIVTNTFCDALRRQRARPQQVPLEEEPMAGEEEAAEPLPWESITSEELRAAVERLPDDVRATYRLFAFDGKDYIEIAAVLGIAKGTVGTRILRARKRLRVLLASGQEGQR